MILIQVHTPLLYSYLFLGIYCLIQHQLILVTLAQAHNLLENRGSS